MLGLYARRVLLDVHGVPLTQSEFALLPTRAQRANQAISSRELLRLMWGEDWHVNTTPIPVHVRCLRRKLEESAARPRFIRTVRGIGCKFDPWRVPHQAAVGLASVA